ncbi:hypothetical protein P0G10_18380 [Eubacteriales bacterium DFI.9.88]|nr:hypothetical protein [Eubacteriales bacterium DFI.9.88]
MVTLSQVNNSKNSLNLVKKLPIWYTIFPIKYGVAARKKIVNLAATWLARYSYMQQLVCVTNGKHTKHPVDKSAMASEKQSHRFHAEFWRREK